MEKIVTDGLGRTVRQAVRVLRGDLVVTVYVAALLALGLGAVTAMFSVIYGLLLRPLPYVRPERLVRIELLDSKTMARSDRADGARYQFWKTHQQSFESIAAVSTSVDALADIEGIGAARISVRSVTPEFFQILGVQPILGRLFTPGDAVGTTAVISYRFWQRSFQGDAGILGRRVTLGNRVYLIVGVAADGMDSSLTADCWISFDPERDPRSRGTNYYVVGRLKEGATIKRAQADMELVARQFRELYHAKIFANEAIQVRSYKDAVSGESRAPLLFVFGSAALVLVIACVNVANLLLARSTARKREIALRLALGASRGRIVRQLLSEALMLAAVGGLAGLLVALLAIKFIVRIHPVNLPRLDKIGMDWHVASFGLALTVLTGLLFGLAPALRSLSNNIRDGLVENSTQTSEGAAAGRARNSLVVTEFAMSLMLLVGTGLLLRTFIKLARTDPGFQTDHILTLQMALSPTHYKTTDQAFRFSEDVVTKMKNIGGVQNAAVTNYLPFGGGINIPLASIVGRPQTGPIIGNLQWFGVTPGFFSTLNINLQRGRRFGDQDTATSQPVAIVNEEFVRAFMEHHDALGQQVVLAWSLVLGPQGGDPPREIIGVVRNVHVETLWEHPQPSIFVPLSQVNNPIFLYSNQSVPLKLVVRTTGDPELLGPSAIERIKRVDPMISVFKVKSMDELLGESIQRQRFLTFVIGSFGVLTLVLAGMGLYGVISYSVVRRTRELGIRSALGAQPSSMISLVLRQALVLAGVGISIGLMASWILSKSLSVFLVGVTAHDSISFIVPPMLLLIVGACASVIPARKAAAIDPLTALRHE